MTNPEPTLKACKMKKIGESGSAGPSSSHLSRSPVFLSFVPPATLPLCLSTSCPSSSFFSLPPPLPLCCPSCPSLSFVLPFPRLSFLLFLFSVSPTLICPSELFPSFVPPSPLALLCPSYPSLPLLCPSYLAFLFTPSNTSPALFTTALRQKTPISVNSKLFGPET